MAYDPKKAHEYYIKYRKKGLKKGRKKGRRKRAAKPKQVSLLGISTSGLNDAGRMQAALIKDRLKKEMNEAMQKETDPVKKEAIRQEYQNKALEEVTALKNDAQYAKPKATRSSSRKKKESSENTESSSSSSSSESTSDQSTNDTTDRISSMILDFSEKFLAMSDEQRQQAKDIITGIISLLRSRLKR